MNQKIYKLIIISLIFTLSNISQADDKKIKTFAEFGEKVTKIPIKNIKEVLLDLPSHIHFFPYVEESRVIKKIDKKSFVIYQRIKFPWPMDDRETIARWTIRESENSFRIDFVDDKTVASPNKGKIVRVPRSFGYWLLTSEADSTKISYYSKGSPGGNVPNVIVSLFSGKIGQDVVDAVLEETEKRIKKKKLAQVK